MTRFSTYKAETIRNFYGEAKTKICIKHPDSTMTEIIMDKWRNAEDIALMLTAYCDRIGYETFKATALILLNTGLIYGEHRQGGYFPLTLDNPVKVNIYHIQEQQ